MSERPSANYVIRIIDNPAKLASSQWDGLLTGGTANDDGQNPFMSCTYLAAMHTSHSAITDTGWTPQFVTIWDAEELIGACALYVKTHSYGEYVFDWAWARATPITSCLTTPRPSLQPLSRQYQARDCWHETPKPKRRF